MNRALQHALLALAVLSLGVLGWDAFQDWSELPIPQADEAPVSASAMELNRSSAIRPRFVHLTAEPSLAPGERLTVRGRVGNLPSEQSATVSLEGPDGSIASVEVRGDPNHEAAFALPHPTPVVALGRFRWRLRLNTDDDSAVLGVRVEEPDRPEVLLLLDHPDVEGARLQRWLTASGTPVTSRIRVSSERYRVSASPEDPVPADWQPFVAGGLDRWDVVVAHDTALDRLSQTERQALDLAIRQDGLGLLVIGPPGAMRTVTNKTDATSVTAESRSPAERASAPAEAIREPLVSPWMLLPRASSEPAEDSRETRIRLSDGTLMHVPVSVLEMSLGVPAGNRTVATDTQGRPLVAWCAHGRGRWARSLILDSWRWRQHGEGNDYARFWAGLLGQVARPGSEAKEGWWVVQPSLPLFVDQPVTLIWSGATNVPLPMAEVRALEVSGEPSVPLNLSRVGQDPTGAQAVFWPMHAGWHSVRALLAGPVLDFYVQPANALPGVQAQRQEDAEARPSDASVTQPYLELARQPSGRWGWLTQVTAFLVFVVSAGGLWATRGRSDLGVVHGKERFPKIGHAWGP
jgi:hypothetical protein